MKISDQIRLMKLHSPIPDGFELHLKITHAALRELRKEARRPELKLEPYPGELTFSDMPISTTFPDIDFPACGWAIYARPII